MPVFREELLQILEAEYLEKTKQVQTKGCLLRKSRTSDPLHSSHEAVSALSDTDGVPIAEKYFDIYCQFAGSAYFRQSVNCHDPWTCPCSCDSVAPIDFDQTAFSGSKWFTDLVLPIIEVDVEREFHLMQTFYSLSVNIALP